jgi:putative membrane protein
VADDPVEDPRLLQANERTLLSWLRTGVALITFGFVIAKTSVWAKREEPLGAYRGADLIGALFVLLGAVAEVVGLVRYLRIRRALLARGPVPVGATEIVAIGAAVALLGLLLTVYAVI